MTYLSSVGGSRGKAGREPPGGYYLSYATNNTLVEVEREIRPWGDAESR
jgi:hypothetical protein